MTQVDKLEVLDGLFGCWDEIDELLSGLSDEQWHEPTNLPGWRVQDVVSHIIGTESLLMGVPTPTPDRDVSELPHVYNEVGGAQRVLGLASARRAARRGAREVSVRHG